MCVLLLPCFFVSLHIGGCAFYALARVKWIVHQIHVCLSVNNRKHWNFPIYLCTSKLTNNRRDTWNTKYTHTGTNTGALYICFSLTGMKSRGCLFYTVMWHFVLRPLLHSLDMFQLLVRELIRDLEKWMNEHKSMNMQILEINHQHFLKCKQSKDKLETLNQKLR